MDRFKRYVIIPAFNEEKTIFGIVLSLKKISDVIVVDDCSEDNTSKEAKKAGAIVVNHQKNLGYDCALNSGFKKANELNAKYALTFDADGQHEVELAKQFFEILEQGEAIVLGIRPKKQRFSEKIFGLYIRFRFGILDILCGMKGYDMELLKLNGGTFSSFNSIGTELSIKAFKNKVRRKQINIPIKIRIDGKPRFGSSIKANIKIIKALLRVISYNF